MLSAAQRTALIKEDSSRHFTQFGPVYCNGLGEDSPRWKDTLETHTLNKRISPSSTYQRRHRRHRAAPARCESSCGRAAPLPAAGWRTAVALRVSHGRATGDRSAAVLVGAGADGRGREGVSEMAVVVGADLLPELLWLDRPVREGGLRWRGGRR